MYDFSTLPDRNGTGALKWDRRTDEEKRRGYIPMSVADMEFFCAPCVREAVEEAARKGLYGYTDPEDRYFAAVRRWMRLRHAYEADAREIVPFYGVVPALSVAVRAYTQPGDGVIIQTPVYYPFGEVISANGRRAERCPLVNKSGKYEMDFEALEAAAAKPDVSLMLLCSPHNPVGRLWTADELKTVSEICLRNGVVVVSDEIHFDIVLRGAHTVFGSVSPAARDNCVLLTAPSKSFNIPGLQLANTIISNESLREKFVTRMHADGFSNISHFGFAATVAAYEGGEGWLDALTDYLRGNAEHFKDRVESEIPGAVMTPLEATYLAWVDFRAMGLDPESLHTFMRRDAGLFLDEGYIFGSEGEGFERFNIAMPRAELDKALDRLHNAYINKKR